MKTPRTKRNQVVPQAETPALAESNTDPRERGDLCAAARQRQHVLFTIDRYFGASLACASGIFRCLDCDGATQSQLAADLAELSDRGYVEILRADRMPGHHRVAKWVKADTIMFAKLSPKGLQLVAKEGFPLNIMEELL